MRSTPAPTQAPCTAAITGQTHSSNAVMAACGGQGHKDARGHAGCAGWQHSNSTAQRQRSVRPFERAGLAWSSRMKVRSVWRARPGHSCCCAANWPCRAARSMPAQKCLPRPVTTMARAPLSCSHASACRVQRRCRCRLLLARSSLDQTRRFCSLEEYCSTCFDPSHCSCPVLRARGTPPRHLRCRTTR